jgi:hypothetical protein
MRRQFWMNIIDAQTAQLRRDTFRASLIANPVTGVPIEFGPVAQGSIHQGR